MLGSDARVPLHQADQCDRSRWIVPERFQSTTSVRNTSMPHFDSKFQVEAYLRAIGLSCTIMRPVFFFYNDTGLRSMVETGTLSQPLSPETKLQQLPEEEYGEMVAEVFERPTECLNREIELAIVAMTRPESAVAFSRVLGKTVAYQRIPFEAFEQQVGEEMTVMYRWFEAVGYAANLAQLKRGFPAPIGLESSLRGFFGDAPSVNLN
jgi:uncharacterized protein YbjT (DUF2867 family)